jgi:hypothetical protein
LIDTTREIRTINGHLKVTIIRTNLRGFRPILGIVHLANGDEYARQFTLDGRCGGAGSYDIENVPSMPTVQYYWYNTEHLTRSDAHFDNPTILRALARYRKGRGQMKEWDSILQVRRQDGKLISMEVLDI